MTCEDISTLNLGFSQIAEAIKYAADQKCACGGSVGSGGQGQSQPPPDETDTVNQTGPVPEGFDDWTAYLNYKCAMAQKIIDEAKSDIVKMGTLVLIGITVTQLATVLGPILLTPWPWDDIIAIAGILITTAVFGAVILDGARDTLIALNDDLLCALYVSSNSQNAADRWINLVVPYVDAIYPTQPENVFIKAVLATFAQPSVMNQLSEPDLIDPPPPADCSGCATPCVVQWTFNGTISPFVFEDLSDTGSSSEYELLAPSGLGWTNTLENQQNEVAEGRLTWNTSGMTISPGDQIAIDHERTGSFLIEYICTIILADMSEETVRGNILDTGTVQRTFTTLTGEITEIRLGWANATGGGGGYVNSGILREARLYLGNSAVCLSGN